DFGGAARATAARGSMASRSNFICPPSVLCGNRNARQFLGGTSIAPCLLLSSACRRRSLPTVSHHRFRRLTVYGNTQRQRSGSRAGGGGALPGLPVVVATHSARPRRLLSPARATRPPSARCSPRKQRARPRTGHIQVRVPEHRPAATLRSCAAASARAP